MKWLLMKKWRKASPHPLKKRLSCPSALHRVKLLAKDVSRKLLENLKKAEVTSIAVDESTDCTDTAQLCIYVRFHNEVRFRVELLGLLPLEGHTTGEVMFQKIVTFLTWELELDLQKVCLLVTDGAPAMSGRWLGLEARLTTVAPQMQLLHRIIHQSVLCAKPSGDLKNTMDTVMNISSAQLPAYNTAFSVWCLPTCLRNTRTCLFITMSDG